MLLLDRFLSRIIHLYNMVVYSQIGCVYVARYGR